MKLSQQTGYGLTGANIHRVHMFMWVLQFRKLIATALVRTCICRVLVVDGYLYPQVYSMTSHFMTKVFMLLYTAVKLRH